MRYDEPGTGMCAAYHVPVMRDEVLWLLRPRAGGTYVDCTVGGGGHAESILERIAPGGFLLGIDRDPAAIEFAARALARFAGSFRLVRGNFRDLEALLAAAGVRSVDGVLFDLGASSRQFDDPTRGFSYQEDAPLDMRMEPDAGASARDLVNTLSCDEIARILREYGEERWASRIARFIVERRESGPIVTTGQLVEVIKQAVPASARRRGPHPAKRTFQALRIAVNQELDNLREGIGQAIAALAPGGRLVAISYHSLEDRIVKHELADSRARVRAVSARPILPCDEEKLANPRSRSAKLRAAERFYRDWEGNTHDIGRSSTSRPSDGQGGT